MLKKLIFLTALGAMLSGCFMAPMAFIGPATSGFSTASIAQSGVTSVANYMIKKRTGKTFMEHAVYSINVKKRESISQSIQQTYLPRNNLLKINTTP